MPILLNTYRQGLKEAGQTFSSRGKVGETKKAGLPYSRRRVRQLQTARLFRRSSSPWKGHVILRGFARAVDQVRSIFTNETHTTARLEGVH